jgi:DNA repair exonuclease SbcCD nuclease subunit
MVYSDIHYDRLGARCVTLDDCKSVEKAFYNRFAEGGFDFTIFCGDRFLKREPEDEVKTLADMTLLNVSGLHYHLIGNHDWVTKSQKWHTSMLVAHFNQCGGRFIIDAPGTRSHIAGRERPLEVRIHSLPAGFEMEMQVYETDPNALNIFIFHDMVMGCKLDDAGNVLAESGMRLSEIDRPEFDLVLGGDIHIPQRLPFKNTTGGYVGSVMQRTRADANCERGWMEVTATRLDGVWNFDIDFVPVRQFFTKFSFQVDDNTHYEDCHLSEEHIKDTCCEVELQGLRENVDRVADDQRWANYLEYYGVRNIDVSRKYNVEQSEVIVDMSNSSGLRDDMNIYLDSGFANTGDVSREHLFKVLDKILEDYHVV